MRISLKKLLIAAALIAVPATASALDLRVEGAQDVRASYHSGRISLEYQRGQVLSQQNLHGPAGEVEIVTVHFVDPVHSTLARDAFLSVSLYERAPVVEDASSPEDAIAKNFIVALTKGLGDRAIVRAERVELGGQSVEGYRVALPDTVRANDAVFYVQAVGEGYALVYAQVAPRDTLVRAAIDEVVQSLAFGAK